MNLRILTAIFALLATSAAAPLPRLKVSDNKRFLVAADGRPFFWLGDRTWELFHRLNWEEAIKLFENRAARKFNVLQSVAIAELDGHTDPNPYGHLPFIDLDATKPAVQDGPQNDYWDHVDFIVRKANARGFYLGFLPTWGCFWHDTNHTMNPSTRLTRRDFTKTTLLAGTAVASGGFAADPPRKRIRTGLIGCGSVSHQYLPQLNNSPFTGVALHAENKPVAARLPVGGDLPGSLIQSWLANSFSRDKGHHSVPVTAIAIAVTPDGTVFSAGVAEGYGGAASYKDGKFVTKYDYDSGFGSSASAVAVDDTFVYIGTGVGLFRTRLGDEGINRTPITSGKIHGLALRDGELYVSDSAAGKIRVLATETMKEVRSFAAPNPGPIVVAADGRIWAIQGKPEKESFNRGGLKIGSFSKEGQPGPEITDFESPCALTFDPKGRLLVGGLNRHSQIWIYDVSGTPRKVDTFGAEGGIFSGEPGNYQPKKFHWIRGLGFDAAGNLYVAGVFGSWYNALIEAYSPTGQRLWDVYGLGNWLDTACTDPNDENIVYTKENVFSMDWSQSSGREQSLTGLTVDRFKYPLDCRVTDGHGPSHRLINGVRRVGGKLFLYCGGQGTGSLEIYKFGEKGYVAAPCGYVAGASPWRPGNGKRWPEDAETFIWTDGNGNGAPDPVEFAAVERKPRWGFMHLDAAAGIWHCSGDGTIFHLPCEGLDERGNPIYRRASEVSYKYPPEFTGDRLRRLFYIPGDDVMIAGGSPGTEENACNLLICFDHWSDPAQRTKRWMLNLPLNDKSYTPDSGYGGGLPVAMQACGKYFFVAYGYGLIRVHRLDDGEYVGTIRPDINGFKGSGGCVDSDNALNVTLRKNGEYVLFLENAGLNHVMMFRWTPPTE